MMLRRRLFGLLALMLASTLALPALATVNTTQSQVTVACNSVTTGFTFTFPGVSNGDISVSVTDASGIETALTAVTQYTLVLNSAPAGQIWGLGGTVTYPLTGPACPTGSQITIVRTVPLKQTVTLSNQGSLVPKAVEQGLDLLAMQSQQLNDQIGRQITVAPSDPPPLPLPPAAQRANQALVFDGSGNPIAGAIPGTGVISSAMQPVVSAATLSIGRTAFGLGAAAVENIGGGLQDDGSGNLRTIFLPVADATNQAVLGSFHLTEHHASGAITYTNPKASTLWAGFGYWVYALNAPVTFAIDSGDSFAGAASGTSYIIAPGSRVFISTDGTTTWYVRGVQAVGLNTPLNLQLNASVASSTLAISVKDGNGNNPSTTSPVLLAFRDPTAANGNPVVRAITGALSITLPNGASLGTANNVPFRLWVVAFDNGGTIVLGTIECVVGNSSPTAIFPLDETTPQNATLVSGGATSAGVFYGASGVTAKAFRILGYVEFNAGQATAGTWASAPTKIQLFGSGVDKPGAVVQRSYGTTATLTTTTGGPTATALLATIAPLSTANLMKFEASGELSVNQVNAAGSAFVRRGSTTVGNTAKMAIASGAATLAQFATPATMFGLDAPGNIASPITYTVNITTTAGTLSFPESGIPSTIIVEEIMG